MFTFYLSAFKVMCFKPQQENVPEDREVICIRGAADCVTEFISVVDVLP